MPSEIPSTIYSLTHSLTRSIKLSLCSALGPRLESGSSIKELSIHWGPVGKGDRLMHTLMIQQGKTYCRGVPRTDRAHKRV